MNAVIYARYSSDRQTEQSIEGQLHVCQAYAEREGITIVGTYIDRAISGKTDNRPDFQRMIEDSSRKQWEAILVYKLDRFSRDRYASAVYKHKLTKNGVRVISVTENISNSPEGILMESVLEGMAEYYSAELSQKIKRGMKETALKGKATGGQKVLGYRVNAEQRFEIDPETAPVVQLVYQQYAAGETSCKIITALNDKGYRTVRGTPFNRNSLVNILKNQKYIGIYKSGEVVLEGAIPPIIDKEVFDMVQKRLERNRRAPGRGKAQVDYLLSGKLFCGLCGSKMVADCGKSNTGVTYNYYKCAKRKRQNACKKKPVAKDWIEDLVIEDTIHYALSDDFINYIADEIISLQNSDNEINAVKKSLQIQTKEVNKSIANIIKAIENGIFAESVNERLAQLESRKKELQLEIIQHEIDAPTLSREQIVSWMKKFKKGDKKSPEFRKKLVDTFVNAVYVFEDKLVITYNYSCHNNKNEITLNDLTEVLDACTVSDNGKSSPPQ